MVSRIIVDSCCDATPEMKKEMGITTVPLSMLLGSKEFIDDQHLDMGVFLDEMKTFAGKSGSASPPPFLYQEAIEASEESYVITLSSKLSGSYNNALVGNNQAEANSRGAAHIFDSQSAAAGETLIALKLHELIKAGLSKQSIIETINRFIKSMKTYFVLENYDNLQKNGRLSKIKASLIQLLNIKLIMGADGNGEIALFDKCRGTKQMIHQLLSLIENSGRESKNENLVITHCNNLSLAEHLKTLISERFGFRGIYIVPAGGLTSLYADNKGIVLAF